MNKKIDIPLYCEIRTQEDLKAYRSAIYKRWYEKNKEKKIAYVREWKKKKEKLKANQ
ncbi:hypothetical protein [Clostridium sp.]|uniref:hypothetical protein n=1 Tax=Clostridium sp. TaxID=1506 RepID=UPI001B6379AB|nr:hypothetical protein [Clostridium sp.]MBP3915805.1 hypothetical protein [Clostridium sp.]